MTYFNEDFLRFLEELAQNNHKKWFDENRKRYERNVKSPFRKFIADMIELIKPYKPELSIEPKHAAFRINRDIRFAKDKTPYKSHVAANIGKYGTRDKARPGFYIHFGYDQAILGGGAYMLDTQRLQAIREIISEQLDTFQKTIKDSDFVDYWGSVQGNQHKRIPKEFKSIYDQEPLIANKQFYVFETLAPEIVLEPDLPAKVMDYYQALRPFNEFLEQAFEE